MEIYQLSYYVCHWLLALQFICLYQFYKSDSWENYVEAFPQKHVFRCTLNMFKLDHLNYLFMACKQIGFLLRKWFLISKVVLYVLRDNLKSLVFWVIQNEQVAVGFKQKSDGSSYFDPFIFVYCHFLVSLFQLFGVCLFIWFCLNESGHGVGLASPLDN